MPNCAFRHVEVSNVLPASFGGGGIAVVEQTFLFCMVGAFRNFLGSFALPFLAAAALIDFWICLSSSVSEARSSLTYSCTVAHVLRSASLINFII